MLICVVSGGEPRSVPVGDWAWDWPAEGVPLARGWYEEASWMRLSVGEVADEFDMRDLACGRFASLGISTGLRNLSVTIRTGAAKDPTRTYRRYIRP